MLVGIFSLYLFCICFVNVLPAFGGKHIFEERLLQISCARGVFHTQTGFKTTTYGRAFPPCAMQKNRMFCRVSGKWPTLEAPFGITSALACILKQIFIFSVLTLPLFLASVVGRHFSLRLHGSRPSSNGMLEFADHKLSRQA